MDDVRSGMIGAGCLPPGAEDSKDVDLVEKRECRLALRGVLSDLRSGQDGVLQAARLFSADSWIC